MPRLVRFLILGLVVSACARDDEGDLAARLGQWFYLDDLRYFKSEVRCTAAVFRVVLPATRPSLPVQNRVNDAKEAFSLRGLAALQIEGASPNDLTDALLLRGRGTMGKQALGSAAQAVPCFEKTFAETALRDALTRPGATLAYDGESEGLIVLDPVARLVFYVAGDVW